jgi:predicted secreted Zn-dependent protease
MIESAEALAWRRSRRCSNGTCVEVATDGRQIFVRDSKNSRNAVLAFTPEEWAAFVGGVREGDFDF